MHAGALLEKAQHANLHTYIYVLIYERRPQMKNDGLVASHDIPGLGITVP